MPIRFRIPLPGPFVWVPGRRQRRSAAPYADRRRWEDVRRQWARDVAAARAEVEPGQARWMFEHHNRAADKAFRSARKMEMKGRARDAARWNRLGVKHMRKAQEVVRNFPGRG